MDLSAVILAGGQSRRMGRDKAWLELGGQTLLTRALATARAAGARELFISGRPGVDYTALGCPVLFDLESDRGPLSGIERGLWAATGSLVLVLAVDLPRVTPRFLAGLVAASEPHTGVVPRVGTALEPLAAIYPKRCHALAADHLARGVRAARDFAEACLRAGLVRVWPVGAEDAGCFENWNTPADAASAGAVPCSRSTPSAALPG